MSPCITVTTRRLKGAQVTAGITPGPGAMPGRFLTLTPVMTDRESARSLEAPKAAPTNGHGAAARVSARLSQEANRTSERR